MLTGLIVACEEADAGLRAELPVAGQTVLEQQARTLSEIGVTRVLLVAEALPPALALAANRLRRDGIAVEIARAVDDMVLRVRPEERLLLMADGVVCGADTAARLAGATIPAVLVLPDAGETRGWELIDATTRWGGMLLADGELVRRTARMVGDWDLQSTLLRTAIQAGAERVDARGSSLLAQVTDARAAAAIDAAIVQAARRTPVNLLDRWLFDPLARWAAPHAMAAKLDPAWLRGLSVALWLSAGLLFVAGWRGSGLVAALAAGPINRLGQHLVQLARRREAPGMDLWVRLAAAPAAAALGLSLGTSSFVLALATIAFIVALDRHEAWIARPRPRPLFLADPDMLAWGLLPFALAGWWSAGLAAQALLAFGSLLVVQRLTRRQS